MTHALVWETITLSLPKHGQLVALKIKDGKGGPIAHVFGSFDQEKRRWTLDESDNRENFEVSSWAALPTFTCPHCGKETERPRAVFFDKVLMSRATCRQCHQEFLI